MSGSIAEFLVIAGFAILIWQWWFSGRLDCMIDRLDRIAVALEKLEETSQ